MTTDAIAKESKAVKAELQPKWVAVIYYSAKEARMSDEEFDDKPIPLQRAPLWRSFGLKPRLNPATQQLEASDIQFKPGANLGILAWQLEEILSNPLSKSFFDDGTMEVIEPIASKAQGEKYFRFNCFELPQALKLVRATTHESWLDEWGQEEKREEVLRAMSEQKEKIFKRRERNKAS